MPPTSPTPHRGAAGWPAWSWRLLLLAGACAALATVWVLLAWSTGRQSAWMAVLAALDAAWVLRLTGWPAGQSRAIAGMLSTALTIAVANWWIIAVNVGAQFGFEPWESSLRLGFRHAWLLGSMANDGLDLALYAAAVLVAGWISR